MAKKTEETRVVSFRAPLDMIAKIDKIADEIPRGSKQKVVQEVFFPAFDRYFQKHLKKAAA